MGTRVVVATRNAGKLRELRELFAARGLEVVDLNEAGIPATAAEELLEDGDTFEGNALAKARHFFRDAGGLPVVADDSGLAVTALNGAPGVRSRRWAGASGDDRAVSAVNNAYLLEQLAGCTDRSAEFVCAAAYVDAERELVRRGVTRGEILAVPDGPNGFGYDPFFRSEELGMSFGRAGAGQKASVSHRTRAFSALLDDLGGSPPEIAARVATSVR